MVELVQRKRREFDISLSLIGVIPILVFVYLLTAKVSSLKIFVGEIGYIVLATLIVFLVGTAVYRKLFWDMLKELLEKNRLAAIAETTLTLAHEINNPLLIMCGNLELLENEFKEKGVSESMNSKLHAIKNHCERIRQVTNKISKLSKPESITIYHDIKMIDLNSSK
jgi:signal transduction histidine kinase